MNALLVAEGDGETFVRQGPGAYLKAAREERGWDVTHIANAMHLDEDTVEALEADDFESLTSPVFVQGYLRKYARLVDTPSEPLLRAYRDLRPPDESEPRQNLRAAAGKPEMHSNHAFVRIVSFVVICLMLGLLFVWWQGHLQDAEPGFLERAMDRIGGEEAASPEDAEPLPPMPAGISGDDVVQPFIYHGEETADPARDEIETAEDLKPTPGEAQTVEQGGAGETQAEPEGAPAVTEAEASDQTTVAGAPQAVSEGEAAARSATAEDPYRVVFHFDRTSWVDVRDGNGRLLIVGEKGGGLSEQLTSGEPPFAVVLGRADAVRVEVNGAPFDLAPHSRKNVARFKLDQGALGLN